MHMCAVCICVLFVCTDAYILIHIFPLHFKHRAKLSLNIFLRNLSYFCKEKLCFKGAEREWEWDRKWEDIDVVTPNSRPVPWGWSWPLGTILPDSLLQGGNKWKSELFTVPCSEPRQATFPSIRVPWWRWFLHLLAAFPGKFCWSSENISYYVWRAPTEELIVKEPRLILWWTGGSVLTPGPDITITWGKGDGLCVGAGYWLDVRFPTAP